MVKQVDHLHGNAPDHAPIALLIIDMINDFDFPDGDALRRHTEPVAKQIAKLKKRCRQARIPVVYCNDNFGRWQSNFNSQVDHCTANESRGKEIVGLLSPEAEDYFVLKPKHSAFFNTTLDLLLRHLGAQTLVLSGITTDICVLFTANDAYVRGYQLIIATDCVAASDQQHSQQAIELMQRVLKAKTMASDALELEREMQERSKEHA